jgi:hypothetical protein
VPIDATVTQSPGWWLNRLGKQLLDSERQRRLTLLDDWYRGVPPLPAGQEAAADAFHAFLRESQSNFAELIIEAPQERMTPVGIRTSADSDETGDADAWRIWQRAGLAAAAPEVHRTFLRCGEAYVIVGEVDGDTRVPVITAEEPEQVITEHDPVQERRVLAGLKVYKDDLLGRTVAHLYLPGRVYCALGPQTSQVVTATVAFDVRSWEWDEERGGEDGTLLKCGPVVPVVRFRNRRGLGEFETHLPLLKRINRTILQRMIVVVLQAFKQRAAIGLPLRDEQGKVIDYTGLFSAAPDAMWQLPQGAEMWESSNVDISPILSSVRDDVRHLAAVTRTPLHYLEPGGENQSAEGAALAREGLVFKVEDRRILAGAAWSQVMSLAFRWMQDDRADLDALELLWAPAERYSLGEKASASAQAVTGGVPWRTRMTSIWQFPPDQVDRMESERADDALLQPEVTAVQQRDAAQPAAAG